MSITSLGGGLATTAMAQDRAQVLHWEIATERVDGSTLRSDEIRAHRIRCNGDDVAIVDMPTTSFDLSVLPPGVTYRCTARTIDVDGLESDDAQPLQVACIACAAPAAPRNVRNVLEEVEMSAPSVVGSPLNVQETVANTNHSFTVPTGANGLVVFVTISDDGAHPTQSVSYDGEPLSLVAAHTSLDGGSGRRSVQVFYLQGPAVGAHTLAVNSSESLRRTVFALPLADAGSFRDFATAVIVGDTSPDTIDIDIPSEADDLVLMGIAWRNSAGDVTGASSSSAETVTFLDGDSPSRGAIAYVVADDVPTTNLAMTNSDTAAGDSQGIVGVGISIAPSASEARSAQAGFEVDAPTLSAAATVEHTVLASLGVPSPALNASSATVKEVAAALGLPASLVAASASIDREASVAMVLPSSQLSAGADAGRAVSASLEAAAPQLAAALSVERSLSAAFQPAGLEMAASATAVVEASADLATPAPELTAAVSVIRLASGELALAIPVLDASVAAEDPVVSGALQTPAPVLDAAAMIERTVSGDLHLQAPVLDGETFRVVSVDGLLIVRAPQIEAQAQIARFAAGELDVAALELSAKAFRGAIQPVIGLRATVRQIGYTAGVRQIGKKGTLQ